MKQCPNCSLYNETGASKCRVCNHTFPLTRRKTLVVIRWVASIIVILGISAFIIWGNKTSQDYYNRQYPEGVGVELLSSAGFKTRSKKMVVEGNVRNVSGKTVNKLYAIVSWYDKNKKKLSRDISPVLNLPLHEQAITPFRVATDSRPNMESYEISFMDASGKDLQVIDSRNK